MVITKAISASFLPRMRFTSPTLVSEWRSATGGISLLALINKYHKLYFVSDDYVATLSVQHPRLFCWLRIVPWVNYNGCAVTHDRTRCLLTNLGTNAQAAIPDVIDCLENCRGLHFVNAQDLLDALGEISGTNPAAIPYLTKRARRDGSLALRAAAMAYYIDGRTNLLVENRVAAGSERRSARRSKGRYTGSHWSDRSLLCSTPPA